MHIAIYFHGRVPVRGYGGTQRVIVWLGRALMELGHQVTLLAAPGSSLPGATTLPVDPPGSPGFDLDARLPPGVDLLHSHEPFASPPRCPHVVTLHGNLHPGRTAPRNTIFLSADHARRCGGIAYVHNGLDPSDYCFQADKADYDLFLGRLHAAKGYRWAIAGARAAQRRLILAGGWRPTLRRGIRYVGEVRGERKTAWLAGARCLWMPAQWEEPFGLTLIEALVSGTPVLGTRRGALPEIVGAEVGALGDSLDSLVKLRPSLDRVDPYACRKHVERSFTHLTMAESYLRMYDHFLATGSLPAGKPAG